MQPKRKLMIFLLFPLFLFSSSACGAKPLITLTATFMLASTNTPQPKLTLTPSPTKTLLPTKIPTSTIPPNPDLIKIFAKDFAGIYRKANYSYECSLEINRDSTFKSNFHSLVNGVAPRVKGIISYSGGQFLFTLIEADITANTDYQCFPQALVPVYWGERRYLFMTNQNNDDGVFEYVVSQFCADIKSDAEPRNSINNISGHYFLRERDAKIKVDGFPVRLDGQLLCP